MAETSRSTAVSQEKESATAMRMCDRALTSIFSGPCIFSCAAKAFLKGVGVLGVGIVTVLRNVGVRDLKWQRIQYVVHKLWEVTLRSWNVMERSVILFCEAFLPVILFLVLGCGLFVDWCVDETPLATNGSRGECRGVQAEVFSSWYVTNLGRRVHKQTMIIFIPSTLRGISFGR